MKRRLLMLGATVAMFAAASAFAADDKKPASKQAAEDETFDQDSVLRDAEAFFGKGAEGLGKVIEKAFKEHGRPNGTIKGEEAAGASIGYMHYTPKKTYNPF
jgi:hypothetical protein